MNLSIFLRPLQFQDFADLTGSDFIWNHIQIHFNELPDWQAAHIALIGVPEERGTDTNRGTSAAALEIRKRFYQLKKGTGTYQIVDLGDLRLGESVEDTYLRLREVCEILMTFNVLPIIIGGSHDLMLGQYWAYENLQEDVCVLNVDAFADMDSPFSSPLSQNHIHSLLLHEPNYLFNYTLLGYQSYLVGAENIRILEKMEQKVVRLGQLRENMRETEPLIREANLIAFDITALKRHDAPGNYHAQPFGMTGEEACQLCWYAGLSERMSSIGFYEYNPEFDEWGQTAGVIATMIWYVVEGYYHRPHEPEFESNAYTRFAVQLSQKDIHELVFYKDNMLEKWWVAVPHPHRKEPLIIPCSYADYQTATKGELPYRWFLAYSKLF